MKTIKEQAEKLQKKQTWLKNGLQKILDNWKIETETDIGNCLEYQKIYSKKTGTLPDDSSERIFVLRRGKNQIYCYDCDYEDRESEKGYCILDNLYIETISNIILNMPGKLQIYSERIKTEISNTDECEKILNLFN